MKYISNITGFFEETFNSPHTEPLLTTAPFSPIINPKPPKKCDTSFSFCITILSSFRPSKLQFPHSPHYPILPNKISTSKYTTLNFLPKILIEQFSKMANIYFLIIALLQMINSISNSDGKPVILFPLLIVVSVNGIKDFYEDWKRKRSDREENSKQVLIFNSLSSQFESKKWEEISLGDILKIKENEYFPADCVLIDSSKSNGVCYIETKNIDGETTLKFKNTNAQIVNDFQRGKRNNNNNNIREDNEKWLKQFEGCMMYAQQPNEFIYEFTGKFINNNKNGVNSIYDIGEKGEEVFIESESFLLRGCSLKQTKFVYAFVVYVGHNTKIMKNSPKARTKTSQVEAIMNRQIVIVFIVQFTISFIGGIISIIQMNTNSGKMKYISLDKENGYGLSFLFFQTGTWVVLLNNIVPISLLVTLEMVKYIQGLFVSWDIDIYDKINHQQPQVQTSTLNEELGQVKFIFSDKTGTLTKNYMEFKAMSIGGYIYDECENNSFSNSSMSKENKRKSDVGETLRDAFGTITNFNFSSERFQSHFKTTTHPNYKNIQLFMYCLAMCHTIITDQSILPEIVYQSSSPDETAMVNCARFFGFIFAGRDINNNIILKDKMNNQTVYTVLNVLHYSSERKMMSVIIKMPKGKIMMFSKGADNVILQRISENKAILSDTNSHLIKFAKRGLRTLVIAYREITSNEYSQFNGELRKALNAQDQIKRDELMQKAYEQIERELYLLGVTAIEDKLQDNVEKVLKSFIDGGLRIWVLTGDKKDTAKSIAFSCNLISHEFFIFEFPENASFDIISNKLKEFSKEYYLSEGESKKFALIVSLKELNKILSDSYLTNLFYSLAIHCNSVLCCRVTPKQKAQMVQLVKDRQPNITTLAIGDGANDVNMITAANIGIGIIGKEGRQAARASDYAIGEFQFLKRLLFVHGRESYRKNSFIVCFNFYKNILFVMPNFFFGFESLFTGHSLYDPWIFQVYNILFSSFPIIWFGIYDKEISYKTLMEDYRYYLQGMVGKLFHLVRFWKWVGYGMIQAWFIYIYSFYANNSPLKNTGNLEDLESGGSIVYSGVVILVNMKILLTTCTHSYISIGLFSFSICAYYFVLYIMSFFPRFYNFNNYTMIIHSCDFYLSTLCMVTICLVIDIGTNRFLKVYGWIEDPLMIKMDKVENDDNDKEIEMLKLNDKIEDLNNSFMGNAFSQQDNISEISWNVKRKMLFD